jgi:hypothetical protein
MFLVGFTTPGAAPLSFKGAGFDFPLRAPCEPCSGVLSEAGAFAWISRRTISQLRTI